MSKNIHVGNLAKAEPLLVFRNEGGKVLEAKKSTSPILG